MAAWVVLTRPVHADVTFTWATIGNAGNAADPSTGYGAVSYDYRIATTEVTNAQYASSSTLSPRRTRWASTHFTFILEPSYVQVSGLQACRKVLAVCCGNAYGGMCE